MCSELDQAKHNEDDLVRRESRSSVCLFFYYYWAPLRRHLRNELQATQESSEYGILFENIKQGDEKKLLMLHWDEKRGGVGGVTAEV